MIKRLVAVAGVAAVGGLAAHAVLRRPAAADPPPPALPPLVLPGGVVAHENVGRTTDPLVIVLHGASGDENQLVQYVRTIEHTIFLRGFLRSGKHYQWVKSRVKTTEATAFLTEAVAVVARLGSLIQSLKAQRKASRSVVVGYSQGGNLAWLLAAAGHVDGAVIVNGALPAAYSAPRPHKRIEMYWLSGICDQTVPWGLVRETQMRFKAAGYIVDGRQVKAGHNLDRIGREIMPALDDVLARMSVSGGKGP